MKNELNFGWPEPDYTFCDHCGKRIVQEEQYLHEASGLNLCRACLAFCLITDIADSEDHHAMYRDYVIYADGGYQSYHKDYDGAPDSNDHRLVYSWGGFTMLQLLAEIDENIEWVQELKY